MCSILVMQSEQHVIYRLMLTVLTQIRPNKMLGLIWIQTVWHSDSIPGRIFFENVHFEKNQQKTSVSIYRDYVSLLTHEIRYLTLHALFGAALIQDVSLISRLRSCLDGKLLML